MQRKQSVSLVFCSLMITNYNDHEQLDIHAVMTVHLNDDREDLSNDKCIRYYTLSYANPLP